MDLGLNEDIMDTSEKRGPGLVRLYTWMVLNES